MGIHEVLVKKRLLLREGEECEAIQKGKSLHAMRQVRLYRPLATSHDEGPFLDSWRL